MQHDHAATPLLIQLMPLLMREFHVRLDVQRALLDHRYAQDVIDLGLRSGSERLQALARQLQAQLLPARAAAPPPPAEEPAKQPAPPVKYLRSLR